ncbi:MAG: single-stranded-DNA-specific exonuclease RecJ [Lachnospiraceae bacterium]|nr:single-stranded-DNA-specific exonuclease RecJ [Lachnospiraceae bacterium]MBQ8231539.1 single-stranded-DNA-specific exonuclease RecJ [Lachnospiraceae bacterium]
MEKWLVSAKKADFNAWAQKFGISPVLARIIRNRDITEEAQVRSFLQGTLEDCHSPWLLYHMEKAVDLILQKIQEKAPIRVIGDYDVDGICSSYILTRGLQLLGGCADTAIPHRIHDGYGLNEHLIETARQDGIRMIVTCDNGIAAVSQIALAGEYGMTVVVTDHHEVPFTMENGEKKELLPQADAIVDPKQQACQYPYKNICGAVVAYKLIQALAERTGSKLLTDAMEELLQFAAIATVCDVMELKDENRILVKEGLKRLKVTQNLGLRALIEVNGIDSSKLSAYHLGFVIGPCLNATGRLDTALRALELLESKTKQEAMSAASELKALNDSRKNLTQKGVEQAIQYIESHQMQEDRVMVVYLPEVHESLAGIIAGKIRESYYKPVFVLTKGEEGVKGSGRSIETYHMYENMTAVKHCFSKFGGHKLAAGMSLAKRCDSLEEDVEAFRRELNEICTLTEDDLVPRVHIDVPMPISYATGELAEDLNLLEPFGVGNPKPLFAQKDLRFIRGWKMGAKQNFARYKVRTPEGTEADLVFFGNIDNFAAFLDQKYGPGSAAALYSTYCNYSVSVTYQLSINSYRGTESLQFIMQNYC